MQGMWWLAALQAGMPEVQEWRAGEPARQGGIATLSWRRCKDWQALEMAQR